MINDNNKSLNKTRKKSESAFHLPTRNKATWQQVNAHTQFVTENRARHLRGPPPQQCLHATFPLPLYIEYECINPNAKL